MGRVLSPLQEKILALLSTETEFSSEFFLSGGSALSWGYLEHRMSEDLDFFSRGEPDLDKIDHLLRRALSSQGMELKQIRSGPAFRRYQVITVTETTLLDLVTRNQSEIEHLVVRGTVTLDSLTDIAVNKLIALEREEIKDSVDLYLLLGDHGFDIFELMEMAKKKSMDAENADYPLQVARLLMSAGQLPNFAKLRLLKPIDQGEMDRFLKGQAVMIYEQYR